MHVILNGVSFELANGRELFDHLSFSLDDKLTALVGPNGIGKTTLAKLLCGELLPSGGTIRRNTAFTFFPQREEPAAITVNEYLLPDYGWSVHSEQLLKGIPREALCLTLSGGQWMRVRLARSLDDQYLILDEPTNDLDREGRTLVLDFLRRRGGKALLISHDRECLALCEVILELSNRGLAKFSGGWTDYLEARKHERHGLTQALEQAKRERERAISDQREQKVRQEKKNRRGAAAAQKGGQAKILLGGRKSAAQVTSGKMHSAALERSETTIRDLHQARHELKLDPVMYADLVGRQLPNQKLVAEAVGFNVHFDGWIYRNDLNFSWRGNVRVALKGANGAGKSTLLQAILGQPLETRGELRKGGLHTLYIDQRCASLDDQKSIYETVRAGTSLAESEVRNGLAKFLFAKEAAFQLVKDLSGGERLRAALACGFLGTTKPELLILDEPTNNLDMVNIEFLEGLIKEFQGALIVISHDEVFLENCNVTQEFRVDE